MKKTRKNPYGLTGKQLLVIDDMVAKVKRGESITPIDSTKKVYNVGSHASAKVISARNLKNPNFREALIDSMHTKMILGPDGKVEKVLEEGLDAVDKEGNVDYSNRLKYAQEINRITDMYAPTRVERKSMHLNVDLTEEELDAKIEELRSELEDRS